MSGEDVLGSGALAEIAGPLKDFAEKLGGEEGPQWLAAFKRFLRKEEPWPKLPVWRTVKLGSGPKNAGDFRRTLKQGGFRIGDWANDILGRPAFRVATEKTEVDLVKVTVAELGFKQGAQRDQIYQRAKELGLELCPAEVGPQLRLQYNDQPKGGLLIGMEPIAGSDGSLSVFSVGRGDVDQWLLGSNGSPDSFWSSSSQWVFLRRK